MPNPTGLPGVFEGFCPPHYPDMRTAVEALAERKFGPGGVYNPDTPGAWSRATASAGRRSRTPRNSRTGGPAGAVHLRYLRQVPGYVPTLFIMNYLQAQHIDTEFYDRFFRPGAYLPTHAEHFRVWHPESERAT